MELQVHNNIKDRVTIEIQNFGKPHFSIVVSGYDTVYYNTSFAPDLQKEMEGYIECTYCKKLFAINNKSTLYSRDKKNIELVTYEIYRDYCDTKCKSTSRLIR